MRRDKRAPALYELMRSRQKGGPFISPGSTYTPAEAQPELDDPVSWLSPGRVVRVPVGYLIVAVLLVVALAISGYMVGYKQRQREEDRQRSLDLRRQLDGVTDPLAEPRTAIPAGTSQIAGRPEPVTPRGGQPGAAGPSGGLGQDSTRPGRVTIVTDKASDPRQTGLNYLVIAQLSREESERAANFLSSKGLEIAVVPVDNRSSTWHVVVVRGFGSDEWYGPDGKRLERDVQALGREYRRDHRGPVDFSDAWWQKFR